MAKPPPDPPASADKDEVKMWKKHIKWLVKIPAGPIYFNPGLALSWIRVELSIVEVNKEIRRALKSGEAKEYMNLMNLRGRLLVEQRLVLNQIRGANVAYAGKDSVRKMEADADDEENHWKVKRRKAK